LIFALRQLIEKTIEYNRELHLAFIDLEKAFDRVNREDIWNSLVERRVSTSLIEAIKSLYTDNKNYIRTANTISKGFITTKGVKQGCILSPLLFIIVMDTIAKECRKDTKKHHLGYLKLNPIFASDLAFADDLVIIGSTEKDLQHNINTWNKHLKKRNMTINATKTKTL
jgi:hypothetical protein